ncbi:MAG: DUF4157 domain-containing protein [Deltaproteobacteria bacterium]|nr:DUF4157 domain-containing protein [Deltaproteobacteria bacterium]
MDNSESDSGGSQVEDAGAEAEAEDRPEELSDEIARKWDPERLLRSVSKRAGRGDSLDHSLRQRYERRFGVDLGHVRVYTGEFAEEFNKRRNANAVTIGATGMILMGGHADKAAGSAEGQALLAHELTHVAQATRGLHRSTRFSESAPLATEEGEEEAEAVEAEELAAASGAVAAGPEPGKADAKKKDNTEQIIHRVFDLLAEAGRVAELRNGGDPRRP